MSKLTNEKTFKTSHKVLFSILTLIGMMGLSFGIIIFLVFGSETKYKADSQKSQPSTYKAVASVEKKTTDQTKFSPTTEKVETTALTTHATEQSVSADEASKEQDTDLVTYTVQAGDSLSAISEKFNTSVASIMQQTNIKTKEAIVAGEILNFSKSYVIQEPAAPIAMPEQEDNAITKSDQVTAVSVDNGNKVAAGGLSKEDRTYVLTELQSRTGVDACQWDYIISRESGWISNVKNSIGYYGLFQLAPGYQGYDGNLEAQINGALYLFNNGGMAHWAL